MSTEFALSITAALVVVVAAFRGIRWMEQTADLRLSLFRPYRGETWPQGVQEDDDVHWRWDVPHRPAGLDDPDDDGPADPGEPARIVEGGGTAVVRLGPVHVGRPAGH